MSNQYIGYHPFMDSETKEYYGSFEVFEITDPKPTDREDLLDEGFYWWSCFPGCLPDGEANGPFNTAMEAYLDANN